MSKQLNPTNPSSGPSDAGELRRVRPPRWADRLLVWFVAPHLLEYVQGDLHEAFHQWVEQVGLARARREYVWAVLHCLTPFFYKRKRQDEYQPLSNLHPTMLWNYVKIAYRNLLKNRVYSLINIGGLSVGLTCFAFIALWVQDELNYDTFNQHYDRIFRLTTSKKTENELAQSARTSAPMAQALKANYAEVEATVRLLRRAEIIVQQRGTQTLESRIMFTDPSFFTVFSYGLVRGNALTALTNPYSLVLTESTARKYFGETDPIGKNLLVFVFDSTGRGANYTVTGVTPDPPKNSHFTFSMLGSFKTVEANKPKIQTAEGWRDMEYYTYLLLKKDVDYQAFAAKTKQFYEKQTGDHKEPYLTDLQPLGDIHLRSSLDDEIGPTGTISQVYIFSTIGLVILLLAGINYTNLATARSLSRAKEVGVKKVVGAVKFQLIFSYLLESILIALLALGVAWGTSALLQSFFNTFTGKNLSLFSSPRLLLFLTGVTLLLGILAGMYPAFVLSTFKPAQVLKNAKTGGMKGVFLRQALVVSQFIITLLLINSIVVISSQLAYIQKKNLGYEKDALLFLQLNGNADVINGYEAFKAEVSASPLIGGVTTSNSLLINGLGVQPATTIDRKGKTLEVRTARIAVDADYLPVYGIKLLAGANFAPFVTDDTIQPVIINEQAVRKFGWSRPEEAIGKPFRVDNRAGTIMGVVRDFHFHSLQHAIEPLAIFQRTTYFSRITARIDRQQAGQTVAFLERVWSKHFPNAFFHYNFYDLQVADQYESEARFSTILSTFSFLSLLIACLGLYGLIAYTITQKTKEIGIRKIVGATVGSLVVILLRDFLKPVVVAGLIALPGSWYLMSRWLQNFVYRIDLAWWMFAVAVAGVIGIALLTVSFQSVKAALANPIKSLRSE